MTRFFLLTTLLLASTAVLADQAYIQSSPWVVNRLPVLAGQDYHQRCVVQTGFTGASSVQFITEGNKLRGAIFILTEPVFKEGGKSLDVTLTAGNKSFEFPAQSISKYAVAVEISAAYEEAFRAKLSEAELVRLKSGFNTYNFSVQLPKNPLNEAVACAMPQPVLPAIPKAPPKEELALSAVPAPVAKAELAPPPQKVIIGQKPAKTEPMKAFIVPTSGNDMVLSDALPQILPQGYDFKFAQGSSPGERISWKQGSDWLETLIVALDDIGLQAASSGKTVTILPKLKPIQMELAKTQTPVRADVILKENVIPPTSDPTKPPSPGMKDEASALLAKMRLDEGTLTALMEQSNTTPAQKVVDEAVSPPKKIAKEDELALSDLVKDKPVIGIADSDPSFTVYKAKKGESLQKVVSRWSHEAGAPTDLELQRDYFLSKDVTIQGDYNLAIEQVLGQFEDIPDAPRLSGEDTKGEAAPMAKMETPKAPEPNEVEQRLGIIAQWSAARNTSLRSALSNWARQGQMQLVWNSPDDLTVPQNLTGTARLEEALEGILSQYDNAPDKPNIQINRDPDTGIIAMIVDVAKTAPEQTKEPSKAKK